MKQEVDLFCRYLIGKSPVEDIVARYKEANSKLMINEYNNSADKVLQFALRHHWSIPYLDSAAGLIDPAALIRKKIYITAAILETTPHYAEEFSAKTLSPSLLSMKLASNLIKSIAKIILGLPLYLVLNRKKDA